MSEVKVETMLGTLVARICDDEDYPGIEINLQRDGKDLLLAWVEVDQYKEPVMKTRLYTDLRIDEPTVGCDVLPGALDEYFEEVNANDAARE